MRRLREACSMSGFLRSALVIEEMIASWRSKVLSVRPLSAICRFIFCTPAPSAAASWCYDVRS